MYTTQSFARIMCVHCGQEVDKLLPGPAHKFGGIKKCECQKKEEVKPNAKRRKSTKEV